jgi:transposase-like protein
LLILISLLKVLRDFLADIFVTHTWCEHADDLVLDLVRKLTKTKGAFPNENSLLKLLYLGLMNAQEKWTMPIQS